MEKTTIKIEGMSCGHCVKTVKNVLGRVEGLEVNDVQIGEASLSHEPNNLQLDTIREALDDAGFELAQ